MAIENDCVSLFLKFLKDFTLKRGVFDDACPYSSAYGNTRTKCHCADLNWTIMHFVIVSVKIIISFGILLNYEFQKSIKIVLK